MSATPDTAVDLKLAAKLQAGEFVWLKRNWRNLTPPTIVTIFLLFLAVVAYREPPPLAGWVVVAYLGLCTVWLWVRGAASRLRFTEITVEATEQNLGLSQHRIRLEDIVAASIADIGLDIHLRGVTNSHYCVYICELTPGRAKESRWVALWITPYEIKANTILAELRCRCELIEVSPVSQDYATAVWPQPTIWQRSRLDPTLLAAPRSGGPGRRRPV